MPLRVKLKIREEPFIVGDDEIGTLRAQGLLDGEPEPVEDEAPKAAEPKPESTIPPAAPSTVKKD
jgi:hypothetical protein